MHDENLLSVIAVVIGLGTIAQWLAWRLKLPSILLLLSFGILAGPVFHFIDTDALLGDTLFPFVSASVAIILFEGGLSLRLSDLREIGRVFNFLITTGVLVTWALSSIAGIFFLGLSVQMAILLGAVLIVTGPTVVIPLLNQIRPKQRVSTLLRWEGIVIDPVGAVIAVLVFEQVIAPDLQIGTVVTGLILTLIIGFSLGWFSAYIIIEALRRYWIPEKLHNPVVLMVVIVAFALSNMLQPESGLLTATLMGIFMANQDRFDVLHIVEFKETLQVLLISTLFILLGARLDLDTFSQIGTPVIVFIAGLILVVRPLAVFVASWQSNLTTKEKLFISWMAPRGIVAASVASVFALELIERDIPDAEKLVPLTFAVIISTVAIYGLTAGRVAKRLGLVQENPQGVLIAGGHTWARIIAAKLQDLGFKVILTDTNAHNIDKAREVSILSYHGNILTETLVEEINLNGIGSLLALTSNDEVNSLACLRLKEIFGAREVFQLPAEHSPNEQFAMRYGGRTLFGEEITYEYLGLRFSTGASLFELECQSADTFASKRHLIVPMFLIRGSDLIMWTMENPPQIQAKDRLIGLIDKADENEFVTKDQLTTTLDRRQITEELSAEVIEEVKAKANGEPDNQIEEIKKLTQ